MDRRIVLALAALLLAAPLPSANAEEESVLAPYRYRNTTVREAVQTPGTLERLGAQQYRLRLEGQVQRLDHDRARGRLAPEDRRDLLDSRAESDRMDRLLAPRRDERYLLPGVGGTR